MRTKKQLQNVEYGQTKSTNGKTTARKTAKNCNSKNLKVESGKDSCCPKKTERKSNCKTENCNSTKTTNCNKSTSSRNCNKKPANGTLKRTTSTSSKRNVEAGSDSSSSRRRTKSSK